MNTLNTSGVSIFLHWDYILLSFQNKLRQTKARGVKTRLIILYRPWVWSPLKVFPSMESKIKVLGWKKPSKCVYFQILDNQHCCHHLVPRSEAIGTKPGDVNRAMFPKATFDWKYNKFAADTIFFCFHPGTMHPQPTIQNVM